MKRHHEPGRPCLCGATDCPECGPAQGYEVEEVEQDCDEGDWGDDDYCTDADADRAEDRWRGDRF